MSDPNYIFVQMLYVFINIDAILRGAPIASSNTAFNIGYKPLQTQE